MKIWGKSLLVEGTGSTKGLNIKSWCGYHQEDSQSEYNIEQESGQGKLEGSAGGRAHNAL